MAALLRSRTRLRRGCLSPGVPALLLLSLMLPGSAAGQSEPAHQFPRSLASYATPPGSSLFEVLKGRVAAEPFNLAATIIFGLAIIHTFLAPAFLRLAHRLETRHRQRLRQAGKEPLTEGERGEVSFLAEVCHFLGEVEAIFGIWVVPLLLAITFDKGWIAARNYVAEGLDFTEPLFVVVVMTIAASRPITQLARQVMGAVAIAGQGSPAAWWLAILTLGPLLGSFITEPAAMTISALLLAEKFYELKPTAKFAYATLGSLFVNVSVGGTLTHFAAPPVLMVASRWGWGISTMLAQFGWKAAAGIAGANLLYFAWFRTELKNLAMVQAARNETEKGSTNSPNEPVPFWVAGVHIFFLAWTVINAHYPALIIGGFLFYLAFTRATEHHQSELALRPALLVGFFLAGLVVHGGLQGWWIAPVLSSLAELPLFFGATVLTSFNDNAAITYLASLVPGFTDALKYAVMAGAVAGGGLTVIANAPNPAGQSILSRFFPDGVSPLGLFLGALLPTCIVTAAFLLFR